MKRTRLLLLLTVSLATARDHSILGCTQNLKIIATGLENYASDHGGNYPATLKVLIPIYLEALPTCPAAHKDTYSASWRVAGGEGFYMCCSGNNHSDFGLRVNEPTCSARHYLGPASMLARLHTLQDQQTGAKRIARCLQNLKNMSTALEMYANDHDGHYPETLKQLAQANYLRDVPLCLDKDAYGYQVKTRPDWYRLHCHDKNHAKDGSPANYPVYDSEKGLIRE